MMPTAWIDSYQKQYGAVAPEQLQLLTPPSRTVRRQPNSVPSEPVRRVSRDGFIDYDDPSLGPPQTDDSILPDFVRYGMGSARGRKWDHLRSTEPVIVSGFASGAWKQPITWHDFARSSQWGHAQNERSQVVDYKVLDDLQPSFNRKVNLDLDFSRVATTKERGSKRFTQRIWDLAMRHSLSPLLFRLTVIITSILALAIAAQIYKLELRTTINEAEQTQSLVAVVVDSVAIPYSTYMIWDEYTGKPIGLRPAKSKISLILLDIFFIIFKSASTALAFETVVYHNVVDQTIAPLAKAMASFMVIGLLAWTMNLTVNVFRTVEKLGGGDEE